MFSNRRISYSLGKTINTGNFESIRVDVEISADIGNMEDLPFAFDQLTFCVKSELDKRTEELTPKTKMTPRGSLPKEEKGSYTP